MNKTIRRALVVAVICLAAAVTTNSVTHDVLAEPLLVAHWPFDGNLDDVSGNAHHATPTGSPTFAPGIEGQALDVSDGDYLTVADSPLLDGMTELTIDLWLYVRSYPTYQAGVVDKWGPGGPGDDSYEILITSEGKLAFAVSDGRADAGISTAHTLDPLPLNTWVHATTTWRAPGDIHMYLDGVETPYGPPCPSCGYDTRQIQDTSQPIWINRHEHADTWGGWLDGLVDEVKIYRGVVPPEPVCTSLPPYEKAKAKGKATTVEPRGLGNAEASHSEDTSAETGLLQNQAQVSITTLGMGSVVSRSVVLDSFVVEQAGDYAVTFAVDIEGHLRAFVGEALTKVDISAASAFFKIEAGIESQETSEVVAQETLLQDLVVAGRGVNQEKDIDTTAELPLTVHLEPGEYNWGLEVQGFARGLNFWTDEVEAGLDLQVSVEQVSYCE